MKKICHVTSAHQRYDVRIFEKECSSLAKNSEYRVFLLVNDDKEDEIKNDVNIVSTHFLPNGRRERMMKSMKFILKKAIEIDADVYHLHDPELMQIVKKLRARGKKVIFDAHEDTQEQIMDKEWIPLFIRKMVSVAFGAYQRTVLRRCSAIITVTPVLVRKLRRYNKNVYMVTNYPFLSLREEGEKVGSSQKDYVFFAGGVSSQWCHDRVIKALSKVDNVRYRLAGVFEENYQSFLESLDGWRLVDYLGKIPHADVEKEYRGAIAGMAVNECTQLKGEGTLGNTKLFEVMAAGVPVICTNYKLWKKIIDKCHCGITVDSGDVDAIASAIEYLKNNPEEAERMGRNGRRAIEKKFNWNTQEEVLFDLYNKLI